MSERICKGPDPEIDGVSSWTLPDHTAFGAELPPVSTGQLAQAGRLKDILEDGLMSEDYQRIELITGTRRRRHWSTDEKLRIIEESLEPGETVSSVARRNGVAPNLLYRWRRLMNEGGVAAVGSDEPSIGSSEVKKLEDKVRELERLLGRKTMENEILVRHSPRPRQKPTWLPLSLPKGGSR